MSHSARITKDIHDQIHTPQKRILMCYRDRESKPNAKILDMRNPEASELVIRTLKWATLHGIEVTFRPC